MRAWVYQLRRRKSVKYWNLPPEMFLKEGTESPCTKFGNGKALRNAPTKDERDNDYDSIMLLLVAEHYLEHQAPWLINLWWLFCLAYTHRLLPFPCVLRSPKQPRRWGNTTFIAIADGAPPSATLFAASPQANIILTYILPVSMWECTIEQLDGHIFCLLNHLLSLFKPETWEKQALAWRKRAHHTRGWHRDRYIHSCTLYYSNGWRRCSYMWPTTQNTFPIELHEWRTMGKRGENSMVLNDDGTCTRINISSNFSRP